MYHYPSEHCGILEVTKMLQPMLISRLLRLSSRWTPIQGCPDVDNFTLYGDQHINIPSGSRPKTAHTANTVTGRSTKKAGRVGGDNPLTYQFKEEQRMKWLMFTNPGGPTTTTTEATDDSTTTTTDDGHDDGHDHNGNYNNTNTTASIVPNGIDASCFDEPNRPSGVHRWWPVDAFVDPSGLGTLLIGTAMSRAIRPSDKR